jgi:hypothetical protein
VFAATVMTALTCGPAGASAPGCSPSLPVVAFRASSGPGQPVHATLPLACGFESGYAASETTVAVGNDGDVFLSPAASENSLGLSRNGGSSWSLTTPTGMQYTSLWNTVDPNLAVDRTTGRVFWAHTTFTEDLHWPLPDQSAAAWLVPTAVANAHGFQVASSGDGGRSWRTADYHLENTADWEKVFLGPAPARRTGAAQPVGYPNVVYLCANSPLEVIGPGRVCYKSLDGGVSFTRTGLVFPSPGAPAGCPPLAANTGVVGRDGTVFIPQSCARATYLAVSRDEGASYSWLPVAGAPATNGLGATVQLAIDRANDLHLVWGEPDAVRLVSSRDGGKSWSSPLTISPPGVHHITFPAMAAGARGTVGVVYYASTSPSAETLTAYISQTANALAARPLFYAGAINDPAAPIFKNYGGADSPRADFIGGAYDAAGNFWGAVVKQLGVPGEDNTLPTTGYVGRLER